MDTFEASGESSVTAWCSTNDICVQSMYTWLKKIGKKPILYAQPRIGFRLIYLLQ
ncbi:hypothetical protein [Sporosarcina psychrophila]|uniref:hypothetical protein n=1 Tax=Sporosarcina psychrophila TaxID=1476 RepID=UPI003F49930A